MRRALLGVLLLGGLAGCRRQESAPVATPETAVQLVGAPTGFLQSAVDPFRKQMRDAGRHVAFTQFPPQSGAAGVDTEVRMLANRFHDVDLLFVKSHRAVAYASKGWLQPLDQTGNRLTRPLRAEDLLPVDADSLRACRGPREASQRGLLCFPVFRSATFLIYWEDLFSEAGYSTTEVAEQAATLEGLSDLLQKVRQSVPDERPPSNPVPPLVLDGRNFFADFLSLVRSHGGDLPYAEDNQQQSERTVQVFDLLQSLIDDGLATPIGKLDQEFASGRTERVNAFLSKRSAMLLTNGDILAELRSLEPEAFNELRFLPVPRAPNAIRARSIRQDDVVALSIASTHQDDAVDLLRYLARKPCLVADMEKFLWLPARENLPEPDSPRMDFLHRLATCYAAMELEVAPYSPGVALKLEERLHVAFGKAHDSPTPLAEETCGRINFRIAFEMSHER